MGTVYACCRRQCIEAQSADQSARSVEIFFSYQDGLSWHLRSLHFKFHMYEDRCCRETFCTVKGGPEPVGPL